MDITIKPGAEIEDATQIDSIVKQIDQDMQDLDSSFKRIIPSGVETTWSNELKQNWEQFYNNSVQNAMEEIQLSANNLRLAVDAAIKYSNGTD